MVIRVDTTLESGEAKSVYYAITDELRYKTFAQDEYEEMLTSKSNNTETDGGEPDSDRIDNLYVSTRNKNTFFRKSGSSENGSVYTMRAAMKNNPENTTNVQVVVPESVDLNLAEALLSLISTFPIKSSVTGSFLLMPNLIQAIDKSGDKSLPEGSAFLAVMPRTESGGIDVPILNNILTLLKENTTITNC